MYRFSYVAICLTTLGCATTPPAAVTQLDHTPNLGAQSVSVARDASVTGSRDREAVHQARSDVRDSLLAQRATPSARAATRDPEARDLEAPNQPERLFSLLDETEHEPTISRVGLSDNAPAVHGDELQPNLVPTNQLRGVPPIPDDATVPAPPSATTPLVPLNNRIPLTPLAAPPIPGDVQFEPQPAVGPDVIEPGHIGPLMLDTVIDSVYNQYPLLIAALYSRNVAEGEQVSASGAFDLKLKGASENGPSGFYRTYRQSVGVVQPLYGGGEAFAGYRVGRGSFQPWYLERQTNGDGEFKAGVQIPLLQNVDIDPRRAALWQAQYGRQLAEPEIQAQLIAFVQEATLAYWSWIAAGASYAVNERVLQLAEDRTERIRSQVEAGLIDPPELTDNLRLIAERKIKLADSGRKLDQTAAKLSLYRRDASGTPLLPGRHELPQFPGLPTELDSPLSQQIQQALQARPELQALDLQRRQIEVEYSLAENMTLPTLDTVVAGSQDIGTPTSKKQDKSEFELEVGVFLEVPIQRRKALGKMTALEGKLTQIAEKRRIVADKISIDVQAARIALDAALVQVEQSREAVRFAEELAERERQNFDNGLSDLLKVTLREQYAAESAQKAVDALYLYYQAAADLRAALGIDNINNLPQAP